MYGLEVCNIWVGGAVVDYKGYLSTLAFKLPVLLSYPILKKLAVHPAFVLCLVPAGEISYPLKHLGFFDLPITNMGSFSPVALAAASPVRRTLLHFPPTQSSDFRCIYLSGKAL